MDAGSYELRYASLSVQGRGYVFPCDESGAVDMNRLSERGRNDYLFARVVVGHELGRPVVSPIPDEHRRSSEG
nr:hypothetical protein [Piscinibacter sp. XHJ-5]